MTQSFDNAWKENRHVWESTKNLAKAMYLAGQQSQQAKIDELQKRINNIKSIVDNIFPYDMDMDTTYKINEIKELLK